MNADARDLIVALVLGLFVSLVVFLTMTVLAYRRECRPLDKPLSLTMVAVGLGGLIIYSVLRS